eukprot:2980416-Pyramimonas_sp.AAC.1
MRGWTNVSPLLASPKILASRSSSSTSANAVIIISSCLGGRSTKDWMGLLKMNVGTWGRIQHKGRAGAMKWIIAFGPHEA